MICFRSQSRDFELPPAAAGPATLSETSVDSFLREVRSEVEASKVKLEDEEMRDDVTVKNELLEVESLGNRGANLAGETQE